MLATSVLQLDNVTNVSHSQAEADFMHLMSSLFLCRPDDKLPHWVGLCIVSQELPIPLCKPQWSRAREGKPAINQWKLLSTRCFRNENFSKQLRYYTNGQTRLLPQNALICFQRLMINACNCISRVLTAHRNRTSLLLCELPQNNKQLSLLY